MAGYNFQTYINEFLRLRGDWNSKRTLPHDLVPSDFSALFGEAFREIQRRKGILKTDTTSNLAAQMAHTIPASLMGYKIDTLAVEAETDTTKRRLTQRSYEHFLSVYDLDTPDEGLPGEWTYSRSSQRQILIGPKPSYSKTGGLHWTGSIVPTQLSRIYQSEASDLYTATATYASTTVTISNATPISSGKIQAGDEFGIVPTTGFDGQTLSDVTPISWYGISTVSGTTITLTDAYADPTATAAGFITAQVPTIDTAWPQELGWIPVYFALAQHYRSKNTELSVVYQVMAETALEGRGAEQPNIKLPRFVISDTTFGNV